MKYEVFREMPVGTMFELSGLKFKKVEHSPRPDDEGYYNALQLDIKDGYAWVKEDNLFRVITPEDLEAEKRRRKKKKRRRRRKPKSSSKDKPGGAAQSSNKNSSRRGSSKRRSSKRRSSQRRSSNKQNRSNPNKS
jgi:hypothetical protein